VAALPALCRSAIQPAAEKGLILALGGGDFAGLKALVDFAAFSARLKSCLLQSMRLCAKPEFFQPVKAAAKKHREFSIGVEGARVFVLGLAIGC